MEDVFFVEILMLPFTISCLGAEIKTKYSMPKTNCWILL